MIWNSLPNDFRTAHTCSIFKVKLTAMLAIFFSLSFALLFLFFVVSIGFYLACIFSF